MAEFEFACKKSEVPDGSIKLVELEDRIVIVFRNGDQFCCIDDVCTHDGGTLSEGELEGGTIACPRHGAKFDICSGKALTMPAIEDTIAHDLKIEDDDIFVRINE